MVRAWSRGGGLPLHVQLVALTEALEVGRNDLGEAVGVTALGDGDGDVEAVHLRGHRDDLARVEGDHGGRVALLDRALAPPVDADLLGVSRGTARRTIGMRTRNKAPVMIAPNAKGHQS